LNDRATILTLFAVVYFIGLCASFPTGGVFYSGTANGYGMTQTTGAYPAGNVDKSIGFWLHQPAGIDVATAGGADIVGCMGQGILAVVQSFPSSGFEELIFDLFYCIPPSTTIALDAGGTNAVDSNFVFSFPPTIPLLYLTWTHIGFSFSASGSTAGTVTVFINGVQVLSKARTYPQLSSSLLLLGCRGMGGSNQCSKVYLDDLRIWSRTLTPSDMRFELTSPAPNTTNLSIWYHFDSTTSGNTSVTDAVKGQVMNLVGGAAVVPLVSVNFSGYYVSSGSSSPSPCPSGSVCPAGLCSDSTGASPCSPCAAGTYGNVTGQTSCTVCQFSSLFLFRH
jgi:hypothetical protein